MTGQEGLPKRTYRTSVFFPVFAGVVLGWRRTADRHVLSKAIGPRVAVCCDVGDEVSPEADYMVLVIPVPAVFEGHSQFAGAGIAGKCGIGEGVAVVPNLHLLHLAEVVGAIKRDDLDVRLIAPTTSARCNRCRFGTTATP